MEQMCDECSVTFVDNNAKRSKCHFCRMKKSPCIDCGKSIKYHHKNGIKLDNRLENLELWTKSHPAGQKVEDLVVWAKYILDTYEG